MKRRDFLQTVCLTTAAASLARAAAAQEPNIIKDEMMVPSSDPDIEIFVINKRLANMAAFSPGRTLLFVHGATYPASSAFDLVLDGVLVAGDGRHVLGPKIYLSTEHVSRGSSGDRRGRGVESIYVPERHHRRPWCHLEVQCSAARPWRICTLLQLRAG